MLQDTGNRIGVNAIAGYVHADIWSRAAPITPGRRRWTFRLDAAPTAAQIVLEVERLAREAGNGTVGTVGEIELEPGIINVVPGKARLSLERGDVEEGFRSVAREVEAFTRELAARNGTEARLSPAADTAELTPGWTTRSSAHWRRRRYGRASPSLVVPSGAAHDTTRVADHVPTAMVFVPCKDGISHSPAEDADPADDALATEIILDAVRSLAS